MSDDTIPTSKMCRACRETLALDLFGKKKSSKDGLNYACKKCESTRTRVWRAKNHDEVLRKQRELTAISDPEARRKRDREYYAKRVAPLRENRDAARLERKNRPRTKAQELAIVAKAKWHAANPDWERNYREQHRLLFCVSNGKFRAKKFGAPVVDFNENQLAARLEYFGHKCWICGADWEHADHVKPLVKGGPHMLSNIRPACATCNKSKADIWPYTPTTVGEN